MTLESGWLKRQLDRVAEDVEKWPEWMKREAEFASDAGVPESTNDAGQAPEQIMKAGSD